jgi:hypothetical protein
LRFDPGGFARAQVLRFARFGATHVDQQFVSHFFGCHGVLGFLE